MTLFYYFIVWFRCCGEKFEARSRRQGKQHHHGHERTNEDPGERQTRNFWAYKVCLLTEVVFFSWVLLFVFVETRVLLFKWEFILSKLLTDCLLKNCRLKSSAHNPESVKVHRKGPIVKLFVGILIIGYNFICLKNVFKSY